MATKTVTPILIRHQRQVNADTGKEYLKCSIQTLELNDDQGEPIWIGGWASSITYSWRLMEKIKIEIELREYNGNTYHDFKGISKRESELEEENRKLKAELGRPEEEEPEAEEPQPQTDQEEEVSIDDLPF